MLFKLNLFWKEAILFSTTLLIGIFTAYRQLPAAAKNQATEPKFLSIQDFLLFLIFAAVIVVILWKFKKAGVASLKFFLSLVVFSGAQAVFTTIIGSPWDMVIALGVAILFSLLNSVLMHNIGIILGIAGVSSVLGATLFPQFGVILLVLLSFYDILAVYWTKHMIRMAKGMIESGAIFGFIIPVDFKGFLYQRSEAQQQMGDRFMILGSGDIGLPLVFVSSIAVISLGQAVIVAIFSIIGLFVTHLLFMNQGGRRPMAALPPIATMTIIGYLISQL